MQWRRRALARPLHGMHCQRRSSLPPRHFSLPPSAALSPSRVPPPVSHAQTLLLLLPRAHRLQLPLQQLQIAPAPPQERS